MSSRAEDSLKWRAKEDKVDASIKNCDLLTLLKKVGRATGWKVYVEPGAETAVSVKFKNLSQDEALHRLLGHLNYIKDATNGTQRLLVFRTMSGAATQLVRAEKKDYRIADELLVKLKHGASTNNIDRLAKALGAKVIARDDRLGLYRLQFADGSSADAAVASLASDSTVAGVDDNYSVDRPSPALLASVGNAGAPTLALNPQPNANGPVIGLVDTAIIDPPDQFKPYMLDAINVTGETDTSDTDPSHGTMMLETMVQAMANDPSKILPVDVYGSSDSTTSYDVMEGIVAAINAGANPINLSLGGTGESQMMGSLIEEAEQKGIVFTAAAGNVPGEGEVYPADYPGVYSVTASTQTVMGPGVPNSGSSQLAAYANDPAGTELMAPGTSLIMWNGGLWQVEGTSVSSAYVAALAADLDNENHIPLTQAFGQINRALPAPTGK